MVDRARVAGWAYTTVGAEAMILGGALYLGFNDQISRCVPAAQRWRVSVEDGGLRFRQNSFRALASLGAVLALLLGIFLMGALQMLDKLDIPTRIPPTAQDRVLLSLLPILGVVCGVLALVLVGSWLWSIGTTGAKAGSLVINRDGVAAWTKGRPATASPRGPRVGRRCRGMPSATSSWPAATPDAQPPSSSMGHRHR